MILRIKKALFKQGLKTALAWYCKLPAPVRQSLREAVRQETGFRVEIHCDNT